MLGNIATLYIYIYIYRNALDQAILLGKWCVCWKLSVSSAGCSYIMFFHECGNSNGMLHYMWVIW